MDRYKVIFRNCAIKEINEIYHYIFQDNQVAADKYVNEIKKAVDVLESTPFAFGAFSFNKYKRFTKARNHFIYYEIKESLKTVYIVHIRHAARVKLLHFPKS